MRRHDAARKSLLFLKSALRGALISLVAACALLGALVFGYAAYSAATGASWAIEDIKIIFTSESGIKQAALLFWENVKFVLQYGSLFIGALALAAAVAQIRTIARLITAFIKARGPIYELGSTVIGVEKTVTNLSSHVNRLSGFEPTMREMTEKLEEIFAQVANLQRMTVSERTDTPADQSLEPPRGNSIEPPPIDPDQQNWERLRELWNKNGERLDGVIEKISDKRKRGRYQRMPRTNYPAIINALADERFISETARKASLDLHGIFMSYKPRNRTIPDQAVGSMEVLDKILEHELPVDIEEPMPA